MLDMVHATRSMPYIWIARSIYPFGRATDYARYGPSPSYEIPCKVWANKCKVMSVAGKSRTGDSWNLGKTQLTSCITYKYLGETISNDFTLKTHLEIKAREVRAALSTLQAVTKDAVISQMPLDATLQIIKTCIISSITYAAESWNASRTEIQTAQKLQNDIVRRALSIPVSTPLCVVRMDTGIYPIQATTDRQKLMYFWTANNSTNILLKQVLSTQDMYFSYGHTWLSTVKGLLDKYHITLDCCKCSKSRWKNEVKRATQNYYNKETQEEAASMSKGKDLAQCKTSINQEKYIVTLPKALARLILLSRCNMLPIKSHMSYKWRDNMSCRLCEDQVEDLDHLTTACQETEDLRSMHGNPPSNERFSSSIDDLSQYAVLLQAIINKLEKYQPTKNDSNPVVQ